MKTDKLLEERGKTHGDFEKNAAVSQALKEIIRRQMPWGSCEEYQKESLDLICTKIGRIMSGNPYVKDHWDDIAGYAKLVADRLE